MKIRKSLAITAAVSLMALGFGFTATTSKAVAGGSSRQICINYEGSPQCSSDSGTTFFTNCTNWTFSTYYDSEYGNMGMVENTGGDLGATWGGTLNVTQNSDGTCTWG